MGNRLSKIYTRTGDDGTTGLGDGSRTRKDGRRINVIGEIDELNSHIGLILTEELPGAVHDFLTRVQHELFDMGGEISIPGHHALDDGHVSRLELFLDELNCSLPPLKEFILPGGSRAAALCHVARAVCRRVERHCFALGQKEPVSAVSLRYLNRMSDLLFVLSRTLNCTAHHDDTLWMHDRQRT